MRSPLCSIEVDIMLPSVLVLAASSKRLQDFRGVQGGRFRGPVALPPSRQGSLRRARKDVFTAYLGFPSCLGRVYTAREKKLHVWCVHEHDTLHRPSDYCKHHPNVLNLKV